MNTTKNNQWMMAVALSFIIYLLSISPAGAQTFTQRLQKQVAGQGTVTVHHDKAIDDLVNGTNQPTKPTNTAKPNTPSGKSGKPDTPSNTASTTPPRSQDSGDNSAEAQSTEHKNGPTHKVSGYRVQVFAGGNTRKDRQRAEQIRGSLKAQFPGEAVDAHFYSPRWICRIGNYRTYEEAHQMLVNVRKLGYDQASIVKGKISVPY